MKAAFDLTCSDFPGACCDSCHDDEDWFDCTLPDGLVARVCCFKVRELDTAARVASHGGASPPRGVGGRGRAGASPGT